ncbi:hypothetical protein UFOVP585_3 [uncultured Caudovirales phage]|uniref:Uncharacterized protein n=1 Tax=uncultured Caudovirales phage TaxID=2100421 RepID=A0A6J5N1Q6_9CAUD|nr:hypothetical protein UFOVP585_3 [uncultured Caudovirales phage]
MDKKFKINIWRYLFIGLPILAVFFYGMSKNDVVLIVCSVISIIGLVFETEVKV